MLNLNIIRLVYDLTILFGAFARGGSFQANRGRHREQYEDQSGVSQGVIRIKYIFQKKPLSLNLSKARMFIFFKESLLLNLLKTTELIN